MAFSRSTGKIPIRATDALARSWTALVALILSLSPALVGLAVSAMLAVDYRRTVPMFCAEGGGCEVARRSIFASFFGIPTPIFGLVAFGTIGIAALLPGRVARYAQLALSSGAAVVGALLLFAQGMLGRFCPYCTAADVSGLACALTSGWRLLRVPTVASPPARGLGALALAVAGVVPFAMGSRASGVPVVIRAEQAATPRGDVTIVDFVDFECPFCREAQARLQPILEAHSNHVRLLRRQVPLRIHAHARDAARAACCGERLGKGDAMAEALFSAPVDQLTPAGCESLAQQVGLALESFRACVADPRTDASIDADRAEFKAAGGEALPTIWIGGRELIGVPPAESVERALADALARAGG
ncbi:MAG TPA: thioredoxin domain-containing protein [Polyangiaceae bacterium]|nr:thioredoxin domain-containing protein [Polyangiaceae bacterium]